MALNRNHSKPQHGFNVIFFAASTAVVIVLVAAGYFVHRTQLIRVTDATLARANALEKEEEYDKSAEYLFRYLLLKPDDNKARIQLAYVYDQSVRGLRNPRTRIELFFQALGPYIESRDPNLKLKTNESSRTEGVRIATRLCELLLEYQMFEELERTRTALPEKKDQLRYEALARLGLAGREGEEVRRDTVAMQTIGPIVEEALKANPGSKDLSIAMAQIYRDQPNWLSEDQKANTNQELLNQRADSIIEQMIEMSEGDEERVIAILLAVDYTTSYSEDQAKAEQLLASALTLGPNLVAAHQAAGYYWLAKAKRIAGESSEKDMMLATARDHFEKLQILSPLLPSGFYGMADVVAENGDTATAISLVEKGRAKERGPNTASMARLAELLIQNDENDGTVRKEELAKAVLLLEEAQVELTRISSAIEFQSDEMLRFRASLNYLQGVARIANGEPQLAIQFLMDARNEPRIGDAQLNLTNMALGDAYSRMGRWDLAANSLASASRNSPDDMTLRLQAGSAAQKTGDRQLAVELYMEAVQRRGSCVDYFNYAIALIEFQVALTPSDRDFSRVNSAIQAINERIGDGSLERPWRARLLEAELIRVVDLQREIASMGVPSSDDDSSTAESQSLNIGDADTFSAEITVLLDSVVDEYGDNQDALESVARFYLSLGRHEQANEIMEVLAELTGGEINQLLVAESLQKQGNDEESLRVLEGAIESEYDETARFEYEIARVQLLVRTTSPADVVKQIAALADKYPERKTFIANVLFSVVYSLDYGLSNQAAIDLIADIDDRGNGPLSNYIDARNLVFAASEPSTDTRRKVLLAEASELQTRIQAARPDWPATHYLAGLIHSLSENERLAAQCYERALGLGDRRPQLVLQAISAFEATGQDYKADYYLWIFGEEVPRIQELSNVAVGLASRQNDFDRAEIIADRAVQLRSADTSSLLDLGRVQFAKGEEEAAELTFLRAKDEAPSNLIAWRWVFRFYGATEQTDKAAALLEEFKLRVENNDIQFADFDYNFFLAQGYAMVGDRNAAIRYFGKAYQESPRRSDLLRTMAIFYAPFDGARSEKHCRELLALDSTSRFASRLLAGILSNKGGESDWAEAIRLLERSGDDEARDAVDQRLQAILLLKRAIFDFENEETHLEAAKAIVSQRLAASVTDDDADLQLEAGILVKQSESKWNARERFDLMREAVSRYGQLSRRSTVTDQTLTSYIQYLLICHKLAAELGQVDSEDSIWLDRASEQISLLEVLTQKSEAVQVLRLEFYLAKNARSKAREEIESTLQEMIAASESPVQTAMHHVTAMKLYRRLNDDDAALEQARAAHELDFRYYDHYAMSLVKCNQLNEAIQVCLQQLYDEDQTLSLRGVMTLCNTLVSMPLEGDVSTQVEPILQNALKEFPDNGDVHSSVGSVFIIQGRIDEALDVYNQAREMSPDNIVVLNNLATILSEDSSTAMEALELVDRAISIYGDLSALLDTKGMVLRSLGKTQLAQKALVQSTQKPNADARSYFHLAIVLRDESSTREITESSFQRSLSALDTAIEKGLMSAVLTDKDRVELEAMKTDEGYASVFEQILSPTGT